MRNNLKSVKTRVGISVGDINGVGLEVIMKAFSDNRIFDFLYSVAICIVKLCVGLSEKNWLKKF